MDAPPARRDPGGRAAPLTPPPTKTSVAFRARAARKATQILVGRGIAAYSPAVDAAAQARAVDAGQVVAAACGLPVERAIVLNRSNRLAVHLDPCDVLARVAPLARRRGAAFEVEIARRLAEISSPLAALDPRVEPRVYEHDDFAVTLWSYHAPVPPPAVAADEYAAALVQLHSGMRQADLGGTAVPHFLDRVDEAQRLVDDPTNNLAIAGADRELVATTLHTVSQAIVERGAPEQLLHGEPHPGNLLRTSQGLLFVDLETCCRGPIELDIAHATLDVAGPPLDVAARYPGADAALVRQCWILVLAMIIAWRCEPGDDLPDGGALTREWLRQLRAASP